MNKSEFKQGTISYLKTAIGENNNYSQFVT
jgi:hypothetical protein